MKNPKSNRRKFLKNSSIGFLGAGLLGKKSFATPSQEQDEPAKIRKYRTLGRTGFRVSDLGFGMPKNPNLIKAALEAGVNYLDTAENYGNSQRQIAKAIAEIDRKSIFITTKIKSSQEGKLDSKEVVLNSARKCLEDLKVEYVDCYMLQAADSCDVVKNKAFHDAIDQLKQEGRVRFCGISSHGSYYPGKPEDSMQNILSCAIDDGRFDLLLVVYNFLHSEEGEITLKRAKEKNIATTLMKTNPVRRYFEFLDYENELTEQGKDMPELWNKTMNEFESRVAEADSLMQQNGISSEDQYLRDIAIRFVLDNQNADCALQSIQTFEDLEVYLQYSGQKLSVADHKKVNILRTAYNPVYCRHGCGICESSCPHGVPVNTIMRYNYYFKVKGEEKYAMNLYREMKSTKPEVCVDCEGFCEKACPHGVLTRPLLAMAHKNLSFNSSFYI
jgi:uncharacterized protein